MKTELTQLECRHVNILLVVIESNDIFIYIYVYIYLLVFNAIYIFFSN